MELSENSQSISGWFQDSEQKPIQLISKPTSQQDINRQKFSKRSVSMCQHLQDEEQYKSSNFIQAIIDLLLQGRTSSQMLLPNQIMNNNNKIQELKRIMEFLQVNEESKYDTYHQYKQQTDIREISKECIQKQKVQFKIKLNCFNKQILQPLQEINKTNPSTDRQQSCQTNTLKYRRTHIKTDHNQDLGKSSSIHRILNIKEARPRMIKQLNEQQNKQKEFELLQLMIKKHRENVQQYLPKKNKYLR
ncbi:unnamed protein product [Paramecium sonneborni]|uniref:Uncharacterized protein n=1 Tax=Paramecium sonneborni TaxID=65129 RepID=A0A8S1KQM0_9CILI|nr:unnamed protein product [Paramecium sonneborni]